MKKTGTRVGNIYLRKISENKYCFFKVVFTNRQYSLIVVYGKEYKRKPQTFNLRKKPKLVPAHENGWMTVPIRPSTLRKWYIELYKTERITSFEEATVMGWRALCGPSIIKPI